MAWVKHYDLAEDYHIDIERGGISLPVRYVAGRPDLGYDVTTQGMLDAIGRRHGIDTTTTPADAGIEDTEPPDGFAAVEYLIYGEDAVAAFRDRT